MHRGMSVVKDKSHAPASKRALSDPGGQDGVCSTACLSDSAKLDRILMLAEHHTLHLDSQGVSLEDLQRLVAAFELLPKTPLLAAAPSTSSLPPSALVHLGRDPMRHKVMPACCTLRTSQVRWHKEMVKYCTDTLAIPGTVKVVTRGFFAQRVSLWFEDKSAARTFHDGFRNAEHKLDGTRLFIQKDLSSFMLHAARHILAKNGIASSPF
eukprot:5017379-Amphidinium_carterae.1